MKCLIEYQGGGYEGCFWEWNYCLVGPDYYFWDVFNTGRNGIKSYDQLQAYMKDNNKFYIYKLTQDGLKEFIKESNAENVISVIALINGAEIADIYVDCPECKNDFNEFGYENEGLVMHPSDYQGNGGIGIQYNSFICASCLSDQSCAYCGEWIGDHTSEDWQPYDPNDEIESNYGPIDKYCYESLKKDKAIA